VRDLVIRVPNRAADLAPFLSRLSARFTTQGYKAQLLNLAGPARRPRVITSN
jgi:hypothetical protein